MHEAQSGPPRGEMDLAKLSNQHRHKDGPTNNLISKLNSNGPANSQKFFAVVQRWPPRLPDAVVLGKARREKQRQRKGDLGHRAAHRGDGRAQHAQGRHAGNAGQAHGRQAIFPVNKHIIQHNIHYIARQRRHCDHPWPLQPKIEIAHALAHEREERTQHKRDRVLSFKRE